MAICKVITEIAKELHEDMRADYLERMKNKINGCPCGSARQEFMPCKYGVEEVKKNG